MTSIDIGKKRQPREKVLIDAAHKYLPAAVTGPTDATSGVLAALRGSGGRLVDASENTFVDYCMGSGTLPLGHAHPAVVEAVREQAERGSNFRFVSEPAVLLAEQIVRAVPCAEQVCFAASGSDAVALAMRLSRARRRRDKILKFEGASHGTSDHALMSNHRSYVVGDYPRPVPNSAGIPRSIEDAMLIAPFNDLETTRRIVDRHHDEIAAVLVEPLQRTIQPAPGFLEGLRQMTTRHDILLAFDENVTAFRLGAGGAQERYGVVPDLCTLGPSISSGFPLGAVAGRADIVGLVDPARYGHGDYVMHSNRFSGSPISCAAALATLRELAGSAGHERIAAAGERLMEAARNGFAGAGVPVRVTGEPAAFGVWFTEEDVTDFHSTLLADAQQAERFALALLRRGVLASPAMLFVSAAHDETDLETTLAAIDAAARAMAG